MLPPRSASRAASRANPPDTTVDDRASIPCLRHHGYASASQIVSIPASSIARAEASISSSGSMVSCMTPIRNGGGTHAPSGVGGWGARLLRFPLGLLRRGSWLGAAGSFGDALLERGQHLTDLLVDDRLQHPLP